MSSIISGRSGRSGRSVKSRSRSPSPARSTRSVLDLDNFDIEDPIETDLKIIHSKEKELLSMNEEILTITTAIARMRDEQAHTQQVNNKRKLELLDYQDEVNQRAKNIEESQAEYHQSVQKNQQCSQINKKAHSDVESLNNSINQIYQELLALYGNEDQYLINPETQAEFETLSDYVRVKECSLNGKRSYIKECIDIIQNKDALIQKATQEESEMESEKQSYISKLQSIDERCLIATKTITSNLTDKLVSQNRVVSEMEEDIEDCRKRCEKTKKDQELEADVAEARSELESYLAIVKPRKLKLTVTLQSIKNEEDAIDRRINKNDKLTSGTSIASSMANIQQHLAQDLITNIFKKLEKRRKDAEAKNIEISKQEIENKEKNKARQPEYDAKINKINQLREAYDIFEQMFVEANVGSIKVDQMKKEIIDLDFIINKTERLNAICEANSQRGTELDEELNPIREDIQKKEAEYAEYNGKVQNYKNRLEERQRQIENSENEANQRESEIHQLEEQAEQLSQHLNQLITKYGKLFEGFTYEQATNAKFLSA